MFWLFAYRLKDFVWLEEPRKKEHTTLIQCDHHPMGLRLEANWMSIKALEQSAHGQIGPGSKMVHRESGKETDVFFIGPHRDASHQGGVLVCTARDQALPDGVNDTGTMIFMGGFDSGSDVPVSQRKCLAFLYPAGDFHDESQSEPSGSSTS